MSTSGGGLAAAFGMFTIVPVPAGAAGPPPAHVVRWLPVVGAVVGAGAALPALAVWRGSAGGSPLLAAVLVVVALAVVTRGLHLDGLADLADGLGSRRAPDGALAVMRQSDIGPFGVVAVVLTLLVQVASLATVLGASTRAEGVLAVVVAAVTGRVAVVQAAGRRVPAARAGGFGALVAGSTGPLERAFAATVLVAGSGALAYAVRGSIRSGCVVAGAAALALVTAYLLRRHAVRRLGGVTGDVFGALVEIATSIALLLMAVGIVWR